VDLSFFTDRSRWVIVQGEISSSHGDLTVPLPNSTVRYLNLFNSPPI